MSNNIPLVDVNTDSIDSFALKYNSLAEFLNSIAVGDQFVPSSSGTVTAPAFAFFGDLNTGFYSPAADQVALALGGVQVWNTSATTLTLSLGLDLSGTVQFDSTLDVDGLATFNDGVNITSGGLDVTGASTFTGLLTVVSGGLDVTGNSSIDGNLDVSGALSSNSFTSDTSIDFSTTFAGINKERVVNSFSRVRQLYMASLG